MSLVPVGLFNQSAAMYLVIQAAHELDLSTSLTRRVSTFIDRIWPGQLEPIHEDPLHLVFDQHKTAIQDVLSSIMPPSDRTLYETQDHEQLSAVGLGRLPVDFKLYDLTQLLIKDLQFDQWAKEINQHQEGAPETLHLIVSDFVRYLRRLIPNEHVFTPAYFATHRLISMLYCVLSGSIKEHQALYNHFTELYVYHWNLNVDRAYKDLLIDRKAQYYSHNHYMPLDTFSKVTTPLEKLHERYGLEILQNWVDSLSIKIEDFAAVFPQLSKGCCYGISADWITRYWAAKEREQSFIEAIGTASEPFAMGATSRAELFQLTAFLFSKHHPEPDLLLTQALNKIGLDRLDPHSNLLEDWEDGAYLIILHEGEKYSNHMDHAIAWIFEGEQASLHYPGWGVFMFNRKSEGIAFISQILDGYPKYDCEGSIRATAMLLKPLTASKETE